MSYILDALRRADAERERDPARGIHAQPAAGLPARNTRGMPRWAWSAGAGALVVAAALAWWAGQRPVPVLPMAAGPVVAEAPAAVPVVPEPVVVPVAAAVSPPPPAPLPAVSEKPAPKPVLVAAVPAKPMPAAVVAATPAPAASSAIPANAAAAAAPATAPTAAAAPAVVVPPAAAPAAPAADRILAVGELPPDVQRELPKLAISGGVHSENASQRLLIVGGQLLSEGAEVAPGVMLEQIRARTAVLRYRGYKYSVPF